MTIQDKEKMDAAAQIVGSAYQELKKLLPDCREKNISLMKLEESAHWANACIFAQSSKSEVETIPPLILPN